jgi:hypothetical protein
MNLKGLDEHAATGRELLEQSDPVSAHSGFQGWVQSVERWLRSIAPDSGLSADWLRQSDSRLVIGRNYSNDPADWERFKTAVQQRLSWLAELPRKVNLMHAAAPAEVQTAAQALGRKEIKLQTTARAYIDPDRIDELKSISDPRFDLTKLVRLCEEVNVCFAGECYLAMAMINRAMLDHVPPIFNCVTFSEVSNNYGGSKSFRESMSHLEGSSRKIADQHLHGQVRASETLPTVRQVDFANDLDVLLSEIVRILKKPSQLTQ